MLFETYANKHPFPIIQNNMNSNYVLKTQNYRESIRGAANLIWYIVGHVSTGVGGIVEFVNLNFIKN